MLRVVVLKNGRCIIDYNDLILSGGRELRGNNGRRLRGRECESESHGNRNKPGEVSDGDIQRRPVGGRVGGEWADVLMASECGAQEGNGSINPHRA